MATETVNQPTHGLTLDDADAIDIAAKKLQAMLAHTYGESGEAFRNLNGRFQDTYLWACSDLADEVARLSTKMAQMA